MINVSKTYMPARKRYEALLDQIWSSAQVTNRGKLVLQLEQQLTNFLNIEHILLTNNGTIPMQVALKLFANGGEVITTPFSYVATTASIVWENCTPVFVDIDPQHLTINENLIEAAISKKTTCILATHVFGNPCAIEQIHKIARKHNLMVVYDAAHCFGVKYKGKSIFQFGDISTCSFHATKLFHTIEGGALICNRPKFRRKAYLLHNFGHHTQTEITGVGINAKMNEFQAAMGISILPDVPKLIKARFKVLQWYRKHLAFKHYHTLQIRKGCEWNAAYFPIIFHTEEQLIAVQQRLNQHNIFPRRYFYPALNTLDYVKYKSMPVAEQVAKTILCLPMYDSLDHKTIKHICSIVDHDH